MALIVLAFSINTGLRSYAQTQNQKKNEIKEETNFKRPAPRKPIKPEVPKVNRYQQDKVFLEYADSLYKTTTSILDTTERQILKGNVKFRHAGMWMYCDSAYYYPTQNSLDAFSSVKMEQGDTLFVYADKLFYDGNQHLAKLLNGPTRNKVTLINKDVTLTTDSLDYNTQLDLGWYTRWGTIDDKVNTLTSLYGEYSPRTKMAEFYHDVVLINNRDGYRLLTDTLHYSTATHIANIESRTEIQSANDTIITTLATYYTDTGDADLLSRSLIIHRDSTGNVTTLEGDSIVYDNKSRISRAYMFRSPLKRATPMIINDTAQKTRLIGGFGMYNDSTREALATLYPLLIEYSREDTLFLRADTIKTFIVTEMVPVKRPRTKSGLPEFNGVPIVRADSSGLWIDTSYFKVRIPYIDTPLTMLLKALPPLTKKEEPVVVETFDEIIMPGDSVAITEDDIESPLIPESETPPSPNTPTGKEGLIQEIKDFRAQKSPDQTGDKENPDLEGDLEEKDSIPGFDSIPKDFHVALAYHRGRFFKQDMQGIADSIVLVEKDSMLYLFRKPIVWSEERQVTGNRIDVHFNDSTSDWAYLPEYGLISEHVEEDFYNQIYGKEITAYFENQGLRRMNISGNVETIFLPQEEDSTFNRLVHAESSFMEVYLDSMKLDWLKMWPEVSGTVTPLFLIKRNQMYLQKFRWWEILRPERAWYGDQMRWADNLGEVPDELDRYFLAPSDFGEPKSFTAMRTISVAPPTPIPGVELSDTTINQGIQEAIDEISEAPGPPGEGGGKLSPEEEKVVDKETLEDIDRQEKEAAEEAKATEKEAEEIEETVSDEDPEASSEEEEDMEEEGPQTITTADDDDDDDEEPQTITTVEDDDEEPQTIVTADDDDEDSGI